MPERSTCRPSLRQDVEMKRRVPILAVAVVILLVLGFSMYGRLKADKRADRALYHQMRQDAAGNLHPPGAVRINASEFGPCEADSGSGPVIIRGYDWSGGPDELFSFYRSKLEELGWQSLSRSLVPSARGTFESLVGSKELDGYTLGIEVRTIRRDEQDFDLILWADPRQAC